MRSFHGAHCGGEGDHGASISEMPVDNSPRAANWRTPSNDVSLVPSSVSALEALTTRGENAWSQLWQGAALRNGPPTQRGRRGSSSPLGCGQNPHKL